MLTSHSRQDRTVSFLPWCRRILDMKGEGEAERALAQALETNEEYLKDQVTRDSPIPEEDMAEVPKVWQERQKLLLLLGDMDRLEKECRFCLSHYKDSALRHTSYIHLITALSAQEKLSEAEMLIDRYDRIGLQPSDTLVLRTYLEIIRGNSRLALEGLAQLLSSEGLTRYERAVLLRRQADFAKRSNNLSLASESLQTLKSLLSLRNQKERIDIEQWTLSPQKEDAQRVTQWTEQTKDRSSLWFDAVRVLRDLAYDEGDLYKAVLLYERVAHDHKGGIQGIRDSLRYAVLSQLKPDLEVTYRYEHQTLGRRTDASVVDTGKSVRETREDQQGFRERWGNVPEYDFWAMSSDQPAFDNQALSTPKQGDIISVETYQAALIRIGSACIELLSAPEHSRSYLQKCVETAPRTAEGQYASELLLRT